MPFILRIDLSVRLSIRTEILNNDLRIRYSITQFENSRAGSNKTAGLVRIKVCPQEQP